MERLAENGGRAASIRRSLRFLVISIGTALVAWVVTTADLGGRSALFDTLGGAPAEAGERTDSDLGKLRLLTRCVGYIRSNYVVPQRVKPLPMLLGSLKAAEALVPDLMVTPDNDEAEEVKSLQVRIGDQVRAFDVTGIADLFQMNWKLLDIYEFIGKHLPSDVKAEDVEYAAINGLLTPLDEHSVFLPPRAYKEMKLDTEGRFGGLGIVITTRKGLITVVSVLPDTPAARAGFKSGDQILEIGDESTMNMGLTDAVGKLRGAPGTPVGMLLQRKEWTEPRAFQLTRAEIHVQSVTSEVLGDGIGYVRLRHFQEDTRTEMARHMEELKRKDSLKGLVLDLRQNPGGLLEQSVEVSNLFIKKGTLVVTEGEGNRMRNEYPADGDAPYAGLPVVVLVDGGSASAAEIVAGALKNLDRALIVGDTTFGKGTVQVMYEMSRGEDGALKLTVAQYLTPGDISIQGVGITPDLELEPASVGKDHISLGAYDARRERDPRRKLEAFGKVASDLPVARVPFLQTTPNPDDPEDDEDEPPLKEDKFERDDAVNLAAALVKDIRSPERSKALKEVQGVLKTWTADQDGRIAEALGGRGIDWTAGPARPGAPVKLTWTVDPAQPVTAGAKVKLRLSARNEGPEPLFRVHVATESELPALDAREFVFGRLGPGESVVREIPVRIPKDTWDRVDQVVLRLFQGDLEGPRPEPVVMAVRGLPRPRFAYTVQVQDPSGNGDGILNPGEAASLLVDLQNVGEGAAQRVLVTLRNKSGEGVYVRDGRVTLKDGIPPGKAGQARFTVELKRNVAASLANFEIGVLDLSVREYLSEELQVPIAPVGGAPFETRPQALRVVREDSPVLGSAADGASVLFPIARGAHLRSSGRIGAFYKVDLEEGRFAFVRDTDVEPTTGVVRFTSLPDFPVAARVAPAVDVHLPAADARGAAGALTSIAGQVRFAGHPGEARRKILIFRGADKVYFWTRKGPTADATIDVDAKVRLVGGKNDLAVFAIEGKDRTAIRRFTLFNPSRAPEGSRATASPGVPVGGSGGSAE